MIGGFSSAQAVKTQRNLKEEHKKRRLWRKRSSGSLKGKNKGIGTSALTLLHVGVILSTVGGILLLSAFLSPENFENLSGPGVVCLVIGLAFIILNLCAAGVYVIYMKAKEEVEFEAVAPEDSPGLKNDDEVEIELLEPELTTIQMDFKDAKGP